MTDYKESLNDLIRDFLRENCGGHSCTNASGEKLWHTKTPINLGRLASLIRQHTDIPYDRASITPIERELGWQPIETAPSGRYILLCIYPVYRCFVGLKNIHGKFSSMVGVDNGYAVKLGPSHWMELPPNPIDIEVPSPEGK